MGRYQLFSNYYTYFLSIINLNATRTIKKISFFFFYRLVTENLHTRPAINFIRISETVIQTRFSFPLFSQNSIGINSCKYTAVFFNCFNFRNRWYVIQHDGHIILDKNVVTEFFSQSQPGIKILEYKTYCLPNHRVGFILIYLSLLLTIDGPQ